MNVTILYDQWEGTEEYPGAASGKPGSRVRPKLDREEIAAVLEKLGHEVSHHILDGKDSSLLALTKLKSDLFFNLTESYGGDDTKEMHVAAFLDLLGRRYTGSGPHALLLAQDKALAKKVMRFHGLYSPYFAVSFKGKIDFAHDVRFPLIVKPASEDGSIGIDVAAVVHSIKDLMERIEYVEVEFNSPALIEEYIEGREIYAAVIGNSRPEALPLVELDLSKLPEGMPRIAGHEVKFEQGTEAYKNSKSRVAEGIDDELTRKIQDAAVTAFRVLKLRDYGRIDIRLTEEGKIYIIEANPNPWLASAAEFTMAARASGRTYPATIREIVELASGRYGGGEPPVS